MNDIRYESTLTLSRVLPRLESELSRRCAPEQWTSFTSHLEAHFPRLFELLAHLYGANDDFFYHLERLLVVAADSWIDRPADLKALDREREARPDWVQSQEMLGGVLYVDRFADTLEGVRAHIPYLRELERTRLDLPPSHAALRCPHRAQRRRLRGKQLSGGQSGARDHG